MGDMHKMAGLELWILDAAGRRCERLAAGEGWACIVRWLITADADRIALHQQRSVPAPDAADIILTRGIARRLRPLDIRLTDHVIVTPAGRFSFREAGLL